MRSFLQWRQNRLVGGHRERCSREARGRRLRRLQLERLDPRLPLALGTGIFDAGPSVGDGETNHVALADLDGDGDPDMFEANGPGTTEGHVNKVFFNVDGQFIDSGQSLGDGQSDSVALGDLDGDGDVDAFVTNNFSSDMVWLNDGSGIFSDSGQRFGNQNSNEVALDDLDGDGDLDAFITIPGSGPNSRGNRVWLNNGSGLFSASPQRLGNSISVGVSLGDIDGDGDVDAVVANRNFPSGAANRVWRNNGNGLFTAAGSLGDANSEDVDLGDLDDDGDLDLFVTNVRAGNRVWLNNGNGTFTDSGQELGDNEGEEAVLGDVDGDGDLDAAVANFILGDNRLWLNDGAGNFSDSGQSLGDSLSQGITMADVEGDGDLDIVVAETRWIPETGIGNSVWLNRNAVSPSVVGRHVLYNNSSFDGDDAKVDLADDAAIASDKTALLAGETASFVNYTSYTRGLNAVVVDFADLATQPTVETFGDFFSFAVGNDETPGDWAAAPAPIDVVVRAGEGSDGSDRITVVWEDNAIQNTWLQTTVLANASTGLTAPDVFYFGNAVGDTGDSPTDASVNAQDIGGTRDNPRNFLNRARIDDVFDFNRDSFVNAQDIAVARDNPTNFLTDLNLITVPAVLAAAAPGEFGEAESPAVRELSPIPFDQLVAARGVSQPFSPTVVDETPPARSIAIDGVFERSGADEVTRPDKISFSFNWIDPLLETELIESLALDGWWAADEPESNL